jgi:hypothetical protein
MSYNPGFALAAARESNYVQWMITYATVITGVVLHYKIVAVVKSRLSLGPSTPLKDSVKIGEIGHLDDIIF